MEHKNEELQNLDERARTILREIVESYLSTGTPVGSRNLSRALPISLSPASIRNVMSDLEQQGLIFAPHTSSGRVPTQSGLRLFVDGLLEVGDLNEQERRQIETQLGTDGESQNIEQVLSEAGEMISGLSHCAGVVFAKSDVERLKHIEFVPLEPRRALVVIVGENQAVENRVIDLPPGLPQSALTEASNYLNANLCGLTFEEARERIETDLKRKKKEFDELTQKVIQSGFAEWSGALDDKKSLIVRGRSNLLNDLTALEDIERIRQLFDDLESRRELIEILGLAERANGVKIFIGSENKLFSLSGSSVIAAPFRNEERRIVGVLGIIGPTRLNYGRIIPMVDYTAKLVTRLLT